MSLPCAYFLSSTKVPALVLLFSIGSMADQWDKDALTIEKER